MVLVYDAGPENALSVPLELGAEEIDILGKIRVPETRGGAMQEHAASTLLCKIEKGLALGLHVQLIQVGEDEEDVVLGQVLLGECLDGVGVGHVDRLRTESLAQDAKAGRGIVTEEVFAT